MLALSYAFLLIFFRLSEIPGLHGDEAWFGLYASEILEGGLSSLHGLNTYTGSLYSLVISLIFKLGGVDVFTLRLTGAILNLLGLAILAINIDKYLGRISLFILFLVIFSSPHFFLYSRIAWEVCAFQFFLISVKISILLKVLKDEKISFLDCLIFLTASLLGVFNHFIFISESLAFLSSALLMNLITSASSKVNRLAAQTLYLAIVNMILVALVFIIKPKIGDLFFQKNSLIVITSFLLLIITLSITFFIINNDRYNLFLIELLRKLVKILKKLVKPLNRVNANLLLLIAIVMALFRVGLFLLLNIRATPLEQVLLRTYKHLWGFLGAITSILPIERILIYKLSFFDLAIFHVSWILMLSLFFIAMIIRIFGRNQYFSENYKNLIFYFYPLFALLELFLFVDTTSERYYMISCYLLMTCLPIIWSDIASVFRFSNKKSLHLIFVLISLNFLISQSILYKTALFDPNREPFIVSYIEYSDTSEHFLGSRKLFEFLKENKVCNLVDTSYFIEKPISFYRLSESYSCNKKAFAQVSYCQACQKPVEYYSVNIKH